MENHWTRRELLAEVPAVAGGSLAAGLLHPEPAAARELSPDEPFGYCLNTSTLQGQKLDLIQLVEIASKAGYQAIEPWVRELDEYRKNGGNLKELGQRIRDRGLTVPSAIDFFDWIVDDEGRRKKALEHARRSMEWLQQIGGQRIAAPPAGATNQTDLNLLHAAERYRALLELGEKFGIVAEVEFWGPSRALSRLSEAAFVALDSGHSQACILADVYHLYKGGSPIDGLRLLNGAALHVVHCNDYPAEPSRATITDAQRVYPGDGVAPLKAIFRILRQIGFHGMLSLELFNRDYWKQDALAVARTGLEKMRMAVRNSVP
jgi:2-keto-myo-inositol isomerase